MTLLLGSEHFKLFLPDTLCFFIYFKYRMKPPWPHPNPNVDDGWKNDLTLQIKNVLAISSKNFLNFTPHTTPPLPQGFGQKQTPQKRSLHGGCRQSLQKRGLHGGCMQTPQKWGLHGSCMQTPNAPPCKPLFKGVYKQVNFREIFHNICHLIVNSFMIES